MLKNQKQLDFRAEIDYIYPLNTITMLIEGKNLTLSRIRKKASKSWVIVANPEYNISDGQLERGDLIYYSKNKLDIHKFIIDDIPLGVTRYSIFYTGKIESHN
ncbi:MAG: hypothetical protein NTY96_11370 [Bacteroidetes bacterium]|nr:hypothetical protein [Bacteroidota bacterium]